MRVDFDQLGVAQLVGVSPRSGSDFLMTSNACWSSPIGPAMLARLDRHLWDQGAASFIPHGLSGGADDAARAILLSTGSDAPNRARNILIADGEWREAALAYDRAFYLFDDSTLEGARLAWKLLPGGRGRTQLLGPRRRPVGQERREPCPCRLRRG